MVLDIIEIEADVNLTSTCKGNIYKYIHIYNTYKIIL